MRGLRPEPVHFLPHEELKSFCTSLQERAEFDRMRGLRPEPVHFLSHEEPRSRALAAAGLDLEDGDPGLHTSPGQTPLRDEPGEDLPASSVVFCTTWPESPPPAQPRRVERHVLCNGTRVASAFAAAQTLVWQVMNEIQEVIQAWSPPWTSPVLPRHWHDVHTVHLPAPHPIRALHSYDMRGGIWERFQYPRLTPVLAHGQVMLTIVAPQPLNCEIIQMRLSREPRITR